jgi:hypothetical protein
LKYRELISNIKGCLLCNGIFLLNYIFFNTILQKNILWKLYWKIVFLWNSSFQQASFDWNSSIKKISSGILQDFFMELVSSRNEFQLELVSTIGKFHKNTIFLNSFKIIFFYKIILKNKLLSKFSPLQRVGLKYVKFQRKRTHVLVDKVARSF